MMKPLTKSRLPFLALTYLFLLTTSTYFVVAQTSNELTNEGTAIQFEISGIEGQIQGQAGGYTLSGPITSNEIHLTGATRFTLEENYSTRAGMSAYLEGSLGCAGRVQYDWEPEGIDEKGYVSPPAGVGSKTYEGSFDLLLAIPPDCDVIGAIYVNNCNNWNVCGGTELTINGKANPTADAQTSRGGLIYLFSVLVIAVVIVIGVIVLMRN